MNPQCHPKWNYCCVHKHPKHQIEFAVPELQVAPTAYSPSYIDFRTLYNIENLLCDDNSYPHIISGCCGYCIHITIRIKMSQYGIIYQKNAYDSDCQPQKATPTTTTTKMLGSHLRIPIRRRGFAQEDVRNNVIWNVLPLNFCASFTKQAELIM